MKRLILVYFTRCSGLNFVEENIKYIYSLERKELFCENRLVSDFKVFLAVPRKYSNFFFVKNFAYYYISENLTIYRCVNQRQVHPGNCRIKRRLKAFSRPEKFGVPRNTFCFLTFSGSIEMEHWLKMGI